MMTPWQLHTALWTITLLRRDGVEAQGMIAKGDDAAWQKFNADRFGWCLRNADKADEVWRAVWRHVPAGYRDKPVAPLDNVVHLNTRQATRR